MSALQRFSVKRGTSAIGRSRSRMPAAGNLRWHAAKALHLAAPQKTNWLRKHEIRCSEYRELHKQGKKRKRSVAFAKVLKAEQKREEAHLV
jgi:hypothetical protein